ncbi:MAG: hypothetical protein ACOC46_01480, partial [Pirellulales bacterium]
MPDDDKTTATLPENLRGILGTLGEALSADEPDVKAAKEAVETLQSWQKSDEARDYAAAPELLEEAK